VGQSDAREGKVSRGRPPLRGERIVDEDLTEEQRQKLERRLEEDLKNPTDVVSWEEMQKRLADARRGR